MVLKKNDYASATKKRDGEVYTQHGLRSLMVGNDECEKRKGSRGKDHDAIFFAMNRLSCSKKTVPILGALLEK